MAVARSAIIVAHDFGHSLGEDVEIAGILTAVRRASTGTGYITDRSVRLGMAEEAIGDEKALPGAWPTTYASAFYGGSSDVWGTSLSPADVNSPDFSVRLSVNGFPTTVEYPSESVVEALVDAIGTRVYYLEAGDDPNRICFADRFVQLRSDGVFRQASEEDWGRLVPDGFLPVATPGRLEGRRSRGIIIPTNGDLGELPDSGSTDLSARLYRRSGHLFAREAG